MNKLNGSDDESETTPQMRQNRTHNCPRALDALQLEIGCTSVTELLLHAHELSRRHEKSANMTKTQVADWQDHHTATEQQNSK